MVVWGRGDHHWDWAGHGGALGGRGGSVVQGTGGAGRPGFLVTYSAFLEAYFFSDFLVYLNSDLLFHVA